VQTLPPLEISGQLYFTSGSAAAHVDVRAYRTTLDAWGRERADSNAKTRSDAEGRFRLSLPMENESTWSLRAIHRVGSASLEGIRVSDDRVVLELPAVGEVGIRMLDPVTGEAEKPNGILWRESGTEQWRSSGFVFADLEGVHWFDVVAGYVDLMAGSEDEALQPAVAFGVLVDADSRQAWDLVSQPGARLTVVFRSEDGDEGFPPGGPPDLTSPFNWRSPRLLTTHGLRSGEPGHVRFPGLAAGKYSWAEHEVFEFDPPHIEVGRELENHVEVTWRVVDFKALERLQAEILHFRQQAYTD